MTLFIIMLNSILEGSFIMTTNTLFDKVNEVMQGIRPFLQRDGGDCELVSVEDGIVKVRLQGACHGCPSATITLKQGIERILKDEVPEVKEVQQVL